MNEEGSSNGRNTNRKRPGKDEKSHLFRELGSRFEGLLGFPQEALALVFRS